MTAGIYVRYSPGADREKTSTVESQIAMCRQLASTKNIIVDEKHIYVDQSISGASVQNRPQFQLMVEAISSNNFPPVLITKDTSRLFRNEQEAGYHESWIWQQGVEIHYVVGQNGNPNKDDNVWLSGRIGHVVAEFNRRKNAKVTFAHQQMNAQAGYSNGGMAPFGYLNQEEIIIDRFGVEKSKTKYEIDPDRAPAIKIAFDMYLASHSIKQIVDQLGQRNYRSQKGNPIGRQAIKNWFKYPFVYAGCIVWNRHKWVKGDDGKRKKSIPTSRQEWVITPDAHTPIISMEHAEAAYHKSKQEVPKTKHSTYLLTGLLKCQHCGGNLQMKNNKQTNLAYYVCSSRRDSTEKCCNGSHYRMEALEGLVMSDIKEAILDEGFLEDYYRQCRDEMQQVKEQTLFKKKEIQRKIKKVESRVDQALEMLLDSRINKDRIILKMQQDEKVLAGLKHDLHQLDYKDVPAPSNLKLFRQQLTEALEMEVDIRKSALKALIKKIEMHQDGKIEVHYHFDCDGNGGTATSQHTPYGINARKHIPFKQRIRTI